MLDAVFQAFGMLTTLVVDVTGDFVEVCAAFGLELEARSLIKHVRCRVVPELQESLFEEKSMCQGSSISG